MSILSNAQARTAWIVAGPTAVGKSEIAVELAERVGGEIVGADAFQIYDGLDVLTAKPTHELRARVPHHLIGEIPLSQSFDVAKYVQAAEACIREIRARGKVPVIVGGTGLYLRALTQGLADLPPADLELRCRLEQQPLAALQSQLIALDPVSGANVDARNPRRVIRALEVCLLTGKPFSSFRREWTNLPNPGIACAVLTRAREDLYARINQRVICMFEGGVADEVAAVGEISRSASQVLGLREIRAFLQGDLAREHCIAAIQQETRRYAKRQLTWFRKEPHFVPIEASDPDLLSRIVALP